MAADSKYLDKEALFVVLQTVRQKIDVTKEELNNVIESSIANIQHDILTEPDIDGLIDEAIEESKSEGAI